MQKLLIVKTSSLGDVMHMLPAVTDAAHSVDDLKIDWLVEEGFQAAPSWSPYVDNVTPVAVRRWRKNLFSKKTWSEIQSFRHQLKANTYDQVIDTQGLLKSALLSRMANTEKGIWGYDKQSIREPIASSFYQHKAKISKQLHAITRNRELLANALGYSINALSLDYGLKQTLFQPCDFKLPENYIVAFHGTSKIAKEWPETAWHQLITEMSKQQISVVFPWGNDREKARAETFDQQHKTAIQLPKCNLDELAYITQNAKAVIGMDTGLMHIAAALGQSGIALYPVTQPYLTGVKSQNDSGSIENIAEQATQDYTNVIRQLISRIRK